MSKIAILTATELDARGLEDLRDSLKPVTDETDVRFLVTNVDIEAVDEAELKEYLGRIIGMLDYELNE